jgi:hypothetical protein
MPRTTQSKPPLSHSVTDSDKIPHTLFQSIKISLTYLILGTFFEMLSIASHTDTAAKAVTEVGLSKCNTSGRSIILIYRPPDGEKKLREYLPLPIV